MSLKWDKQDLMTIAEKKIQEVNADCENVIYRGIDVELSKGTQHFSLTTKDQINIDSLFSTITLGATEFPYHVDDTQCEMFSAEDIIKLYIAYKSFVTQQTTYCNMLRTWIKRETNSVIVTITYGDDLPVDLQEDMNELLEKASIQIQAVVAKLQTAGIAATSET